MEAGLYSEAARGRTKPMASAQPRPRHAHRQPQFELKERQHLSSRSGKANKKARQLEIEDTAVSSRRHGTEDVNKIDYDEEAEGSCSPVFEATEELLLRRQRPRPSCLSSRKLLPATRPPTVERRGEEPSAGEDDIYTIRGRSSNTSSPTTVATVTNNNSSTKLGWLVRVQRALYSAATCCVKCLGPV